MLKIPARSRHISLESHVIAKPLLGTPLATFRRRFWAFFLDNLVFGILIGALFLGGTYLAFSHEDSTFFTRLFSQSTLDNESESSPKSSQATRDLLKIIDRRCPEALPLHIKEELAQPQSDAIDNLSMGDHLTIGFGSGETHLEQTGENSTLVLGMDFLLGPYSGVFSWGAFFVAWFTAWVRWGHGRTLGKRILGIKIIRLDGKPLTWWDSFSRAGGYGASAATLFLGFLEAIFHPNRQAIHDRISNTVVIRISKK
ncbi:MAG: RDD family protein [bacterium]|nr:RDD family protein [bacterium]